MMENSANHAAENKAAPFSLSQWLIDGIEGMSQARAFPCLLPKEVRTHVKAANREMLLAARAMIDKAIARLEKENDPPPKKVTRIKVQ